MSELLAGRHAALEALRAGRRRFYRLWIEGEDIPAARAGDTGIVADIVEAAQQAGISVRSVRGGLFKRLDDEQINHQGVALEVDSYPYVDLGELMDGAGPEALYLLLDHIQDPQNLGTLIRTAEVMGATGVIIPERRAAGVTPAVCNASAGAVEHLAVARVTNINRTIERLKEANVWIAGLDISEDAQQLHEVDLRGAIGLVVGHEGSGLSRLTREKCDFLIRLPVYGQIESLNAAVAGSIVLYAARRQRYS